MTVTRVTLGRHKKMCYVIVATKNMKYRDGKSPIVYIGTTKNGAARMAQSAADKTDKVLAKYGVKRFHVRVLTFTPRAGVRQTWRKLERALLLAFKGEYGQVPEFNKVGKGFRRKDDDFRYFNRDRLVRLLQTIKSEAPDGVPTKRRRRRRHRTKAKP